MSVLLQRTVAPVKPAGGMDWMVLGLLVLAFAVRAHGIGDQVVLGDEVITIRAARTHDPLWLLTNFKVHDFSGLFAVYYQAVAAMVGLSEWNMRLPVLLTGSLTPLLLWRALRGRLDRTALLLCLALVALSPILIHHSRFARPYVLVLDLEILAAMSLWRLLHRPSNSILLLLGASTAFAVYLNLSSSLFLAALWLAACAYSLLDDRTELRMERLVRIAIGGGVSAVLAFLLYLPSRQSWDMLLNGRSGRGEVSLESIFGAFQTTLGTPDLAWNLVLASLMVLGLVQLLRSSRALGAAALIVLLVPTLLVAAVNPERAQLPHVFVRYVIGSIPLILILVASAAASLIDAVTSRSMSSPKRRGVMAGVLGLALVAGLASAGPLTDAHLRPNNFTLHPRHIRLSRVPEAIGRVPRIYREIADDPGSGIVIEAPWGGSGGMQVPIDIYQRVHGREVVVIPSNRLFDAPGFRFERMQGLDILDRLPAGSSNWLILHLDSQGEAEDVLGLGHAGKAIDAPGLIETLKARLGQPTYRDRWILAYEVAGA